MFTEIRLKRREQSKEDLPKKKMKFFKSRSKK